MRIRNPRGLLIGQMIKKMTAPYWSVKKVDAFLLVGKEDICFLIGHMYKIADGVPLVGIEGLTHRTDSPEFYHKQSERNRIKVL